MEKTELKRRSVLSLMSLFFQSGYTAVLGLIANLVLTVVLTPIIFGMYITVLSLISLLNYFSDIGLAASLIQKKELGVDDVRTTFTVQQLLVIALISIGFLATSFIQKFYNLPIEGVHLYWSLLISFFFSSLKTIPSVFLERKIQFQKIVFVQIVENTIFYISIIVLALMGFGLQSFTIAVLVRSIVGLILIYRLSFWMPQIGISMASLKNLLAFGLPFQSTSFLALFKDDLITLFLGKILGFEALGYIGWAKKWAEAPIRIIMDNISKVLFPVLSRIQNDNDQIRRIIEKILRLQTTLIAPSILGLALIMPYLVDLIPKYHKWEPALPLLYIFALSAFFSTYSSPFMNLFNSLGKVKVSLSFMFLWTLLTWILTPILSKTYGIYGFPIAHLVLSSTFLLVVFQAKKFIAFNFFGSISKPIAATLMMGIITWAFLQFVQGNLLLVATTACIIGSTSYFVILKYIFHMDLYYEFKTLLKRE